MPCLCFGGKKDKECEAGRLGLADWMGSLPANFHTIPLTKLAIPGSHNAATSGIPTDVDHIEASPDAAELLKWGSEAPVIDDTIKRKLRAFAVCQRGTITAQLEAGVRYVDLRVATMAGTNDFYICHSVYGQEITKVLDEIKNFLTNHPKEVVIIDVQKQYNLDNGKHEILINKLGAHFEGLLLPDGVANQTTLKKMWDDKKKVILFYQAKDVHRRFPNFCWDWNKMYQPYPEKNNGKECIQVLEQKLDRERSNVFTVCQAILTPETINIVEWDGSLEHTASGFSPLVNEWIKKWNDSHPYALNIVMLDYIEDGATIRTIIGFNHKRR